jgi:hypothetical protein
MGGISANSGRVVFFTPSTDVLLRMFWNGAGEGPGGFVFGTLLGPETTGPGRGAAALAVVFFSGFCVSGFLAPPIMHV